MNRLIAILLLLVCSLSVHAQVRRNQNTSVSMPGQNLLIVNIYDAAGLESRKYKSAHKLSDVTVTINSKKVSETLMTDEGSNAVVIMTNFKSRKLTIKVEKVGYKTLTSEWSMNSKSENLEVFLTKEE